MKLTTAQQLLILMGVEPTMVTLGHHKELSRTCTKRGPGRMPAHKGVRHHV